MPELPEVEVTRRLIAASLEGGLIDEVEIRRERTARRNSGSAEVVDRLTGRTVERLGRKGKFIAADLDSGELLVIHLGMSGRLQLADRIEEEAPHTNAVLRISGGGEVRFVDPRTFGFIGVFEEIPSLLGPDALDALPDSGGFQALLGRSRRAIKTVLLDQAVVAGLGNIYADEVLWRARVAPHRPSADLDSDAAERIRSAIRPVLEEGISQGGTSLGDLAYLLPDGRAGENLGRLAAYGREGLPCPRCGTPVIRSMIGQRSAHHCPACQL